MEIDVLCTICVFFFVVLQVKRLRMQQDALVRQMQEMGLKQVHTEQTLQKVLSLLQVQF